MAVTTDVQGLGIGRKLMEHCMKAAKENQIKRLFIPTEDWYPPFLCMKKFGLRKCR
jgi:N-acetylglutamate synthase-like GNAT family acetyltransferase